MNRTEQKPHPTRRLTIIGVGTIFRLGEQKLVKTSRDNQIQSITSCNMYFSKKGIRSVQWGMGKATEAGEFLIIFVLKVTLTCRVTFNLSYRKTGGAPGAGRTGFSPNNFICSRASAYHAHSRSYRVQLVQLYDRLKLDSHCRSDQLDQARSSDLENRSGKWSGWSASIGFPTR